jgi:hypothetical protein
MAIPMIEVWRWMGLGDQRHPPATLPPGSNHSTRCRGRLGGLHGWSEGVQASNPGSSSLLRIAIPTCVMLAWTYKIVSGCEMD